MKYCVAVFISILIFVKNTYAQEINVRAGEHSGFTRIVLDKPDELEFVVKQENGYVLVEMEGFSGRKNIDSIFERIPRSRVSDVRDTEAGLVILLNCACPVEQFIVDGRYLALDVLNGPELSERELQERDIRYGHVVLPASNFLFGELLWNEQHTVEAQPETGNPLESPVDDELKNDQILDQNIFSELVERISDASEEGILVPESPYNGFDIDSGVAFGMQIKRNVGQVAAPEAIASTNMRIVKNTNPDENTFMKRTHNTVDCIDSDRIDIANWGSDYIFSSTLGGYRAELFSSNGAPNSDKVLQLARFYLGHGFGAEAKATLLLSPQTSSAFPELFDMSDAFEFGYMRNPRVLHKSAHCGPRFSLWALLSNMRSDSLQIGDESEFLAAFHELPSGIKKQLLPELIHRLNILRASSTAESIVRLTNSGDTADRYISEISVSDLPSKPDHLSELREIANSETVESMDALIELIERQVLGGERIAPSTSLLMASYLPQYRNDSKFDYILRTYIFSLIKSDNIDGAIRELKKPVNRAALGDFMEEVSSLLLDEITKNESDFSFLDTMFSNFSIIVPFAGFAEVSSAAERLSLLGFPSLSAHVLKSSRRDLLTERTNLTQEATEHNWQVEYVRPSLPETDEPELPIPLVQHKTADNNELSYFLNDSNGEQTSSFDSARMAENWDNLLDGNDEVFGQLRRVRNSFRSRSSEELGISEIRGIVNESSEARANLLRVLRSN